MASRLLTGRAKGGRKMRGRISLTPLVDVVFILVIFFMLASSFTRTNTVEIVPPGIPTGGASSQTETVSLTILGAGEYDLDGEVVSESVLTLTLQEISEERLIVKTAEEAQLQDVVTFLDVVHSIGLTSFSLSSPKGSVEGSN